MDTLTTIRNIASNFTYEGELVGYTELKAGNINTTYRIEYECGNKTTAYILQKINTFAFKDPEGLMNNVSLVTEHIAAAIKARGEDPERRVLRFVKAKNGTYLYTDVEGGAWRSYLFVGDCTAYDKIEDPKHFYEAGVGFGEFQRDLADFPAEKLVETIPNFHNTAKRFDTFLASVAADAAGRVESAQVEIDFVNSHRDMCSAIVDKMESGELPVRVTHNDTKLNNVLIDNASGHALCVIDLDTVMPGSALYDFGDAVRYGACTAAEDEPDISRIGFSMELFEQFTRGFVEKTKENLTREEILLLPLGAKVMTCELVIRFLTDYLDGDKYFKILYPEHNIVRTRAQIKLLCEMEAHYDEMCDFVKSLID
ncbi:MAG: aminoglycoside phosphotransferase family protein [Ruminococcaceae bacterium]|nr:aminoglycoside phosphotransferase family protein [Oscillospiraceae bacterium]